jgi:hypothetical protein
MVRGRRGDIAAAGRGLCRRPSNGKLFVQPVDVDELEHQRLSRRVASEIASPALVVVDP